MTTIKIRSREARSLRGRKVVKPSSFSQRPHLSAGHDSVITPGHFYLVIPIADSVIFCGYREDIPKIIAATDVLVLPSLGESFGRVIIEAMAMGRPVVATDAGGVPEIIRSNHTGILVEIANADAIAEAVVRLLNDEELSKKIGQAGLRRVQEKFTIEKHVHEIQRVYESVLSSA